ncbi:hypothetical protein [Jidongwangia harbinensis]|uniref:hypothetical protein n=1 Tax=Jidongwangia harbinensis TaxID=2878561 RepID=UPI001CD99F00|nr:hypothetical protein [Jidongwangia harbinensis]MCA2219008.1 hypothetical protein [Jidongwangia harbinensis]
MSYLIGRRAAELQQTLRETLPSPVAGATGAAEALAAALLAIFLLFFFLRDGAAMWRWLTARLPATAAARVHRAGRSGWHTLSSYTHGMAAVDTVGIGAAQFLVGVPLAFVAVRAHVPRGCSGTAARTAPSRRSIVGRGRARLTPARTLADGEPGSLVGMVMTCRRLPEAHGESSDPYSRHPR